jgi:hypothetical protein
MTKTERQAYEAGLAQGRSVTVMPAASVPITVSPPAEVRSGWQSSEFWIIAATTLYSMWVGYMLIIDSTLELQRGLTVIAAVLGAAWFYTNKRTEVKKDAAEAGTTTIKMPATGDGSPPPDVLALPRVRRGDRAA